MCFVVLVESWVPPFYVQEIAHIITSLASWLIQLLLINGCDVVMDTNLQQEPSRNKVQYYTEKEGGKKAK
ncbi:hypothetical protein AB3S75_044391 [Citrus x aurantiifolia]